jgi:hypothetical protein
VVLRALPITFLNLAFLFGFGPPGPSSPEPAADSRPLGKISWSDRTVFLLGELADADRIYLTTNIVASGHPGAILYDGPKAGQYLKEFLRAFSPGQIAALGGFTEGETTLADRLGFRGAFRLAGEQANNELGLELFSHPESVVVCPPEPRNQFLQAACLAGALHAPLISPPHTDKERSALKLKLQNWGPRRIYLIGSAARLDFRVHPAKVQRVDGAEEVSAAALGLLAKKGPVQTFVITNPADKARGLGSMSSLAPFIAMRRHAALLFTNETGDDCAALVNRSGGHAGLSMANNLVLVAGLKSIPTERRANPIAGKDATIEMEPLTPMGAEPFTFATGRLFHDDPGVVMLLLARERLLEQQARNLQAGARPARRALIVSNPGGGLPLLETFSRTTAMELRDRGYETTALFDDRVNRQEVRRLLPSQDIFLWEGHYRTLIDAYEMPTWTEPLRPALVFLQSCLALNEADAQPLLQRGAIGLIGSSTRTYSGTGGAFTLAFFDALLYENQSLGASLRQAKNFLLAYTLLKEKRLGENAKLAGANLRSAWAFTLWGDPELHLPLPDSAAEPTPHVTPHVSGNTVILTIPGSGHRTVSSTQYQAQVWPNGRLAGLVFKELKEDERRLVPLLFAEVSLPHGRSGQMPHLTSRLPDSRWVFCWDRSRSCGYLLALPRPQDKDEIRFHVSWTAQ